MNGKPAFSNLRPTALQLMQNPLMRVYLGSSRSEGLLGEIGKFFNFFTSSVEALIKELEQHWNPA
jgi:hypothetical protein